jgi:hypothetical protein
LQSFFLAETLKFRSDTENNAKNCGLTIAEDSQRKTAMPTRRRLQTAKGPETPPPPPVPHVRRDGPIHCAPGRQNAQNPSVPYIDSPETRPRGSRCCSEVPKSSNRVLVISSPRRLDRDQRRRRLRRMCRPGQRSTVAAAVHSLRVPEYHRNVWWVPITQKHRRRT